MVAIRFSRFHDLNPLKIAPKVQYMYLLLETEDDFLHVLSS